MPARIIDGAAIAQQVRTEVAVGVQELHRKRGLTPGLVAVLVGDNPASAVYIRNKERACKEVGIFTETHKLVQSATQADLLALIAKLNADTRISGILIQLPLPPQIDEATVLHAVLATKDVDGIHPMNAGLLLQGTPVFAPCTPAGVQQMLLRSGFDSAGKHVVVVGRSNIVGKPMAALMASKGKGANATVTQCHTGTRDLGYFTRQADILIAAMGVPEAIKGDMVREGVVVIDVGTNRVDDATNARGYRLTGDVDFAAVSQKAAAISPVPGGVGPMTIAMLLVNTLKAAQLAADGKGLL